MLAGAAYFPAVDEMVVAAVGRCVVERRAVPRVWCRCRASDGPDDRWPFRDDRREGSLGAVLTQSRRVYRTWGDCYGYLLVATGRAEVMVDPMMAPWDSAALLPIIEERAASSPIGPARERLLAGARSRRTPLWRSRHEHCSVSFVSS